MSGDKKSTSVKRLENRMKRMFAWPGKMAGLLLLTGLSVVPQLAWAAPCVVQFSPPPKIIRVVFTTLPTRIEIDPDAPNGTVFWQSGFLSDIANATTNPATDNRSRLVICGVGQSSILTWDANATLGTQQSYPTTIPGIGLRLKFKGPLSANTEQSLPYSTTFNTSSAGGTGTDTRGQSFSLALVKTGTIPNGGGILSGIFAKATFDGAGFYTYEYNTPINIVPRAPTCSVQNASQVVDLGAISKSKFTGAGATTTDVPLSIGLNCVGGATGGAASVSVTLTDQTTPTNRSDKLSLTSNSTATGIAIQVSNQSGVVSYGPDSSAPGNTNQWLAGSTGNGSFTIPLKARYIQTGAQVTPGTANGRATFTMSYQ